MDRRGALEISFGMIFSIILIIVFLSFAFYGIKKLISVQETAMVYQFKEDLQNDINKIWNGPQGQQPVKYKLPNKIEGICIENYESQNFYFIPKGKFSGGILDNIDEKNTLGNSGSLCFENKDGYVSMTLKKDFGENLVTIVK